ncbi:hypothetical protein [Halomonas denitrificans]|nr:hypothetical protein [Halomonas denitrificans]
MLASLAPLRTTHAIDRLPSNSLSVIVPVGPGDRAWRTLLHALGALATPHEIVLSACEAAPDDLDAFAPPFGIRWLHAEAGRPIQLNRGVQAARSDQLWLLHADAMPSAAALAEAAPPVERGVLAWYPLRFDPPRPPWVRLNAIGANLRSRWLHLPFGDQGWRLTRATIDTVGGFDPAWTRGEDLEFAVRARRHGVRFRRFRTPLATSPRRYADRGWAATTFEHLRLTRSMWRRARQGEPGGRTRGETR